MARCTEKDWYAAQLRPLQELRELQKKYQVPVLLAGDLFDDGWRPNRCPAELINFALQGVRGWYGVPGQHDLPYHNYADIKKSAYWTLVLAGVLTNLEPGQPLEVPGAVPMRVHGFPWGTDLEPWDDPHDLLLDVAVVHGYCWMDGCGYPGADAARKASHLSQRLRGFDTAIFGDNHVPFYREPKNKKNAIVYNCGSFMRRKRDEIKHRPAIGIVRADGTVTRHYLDTSADVFADPKETAQALASGQADMKELAAELERLGDVVLDFKEALLRAMAKIKVRPGVRKHLLAALESGQ